ncbi:MAG: hypothetical protein KC419_18430 [Anaerolineales bacterium]|nr:hypothetical protein [Anaerolineales bacterium]
MAKRKKKRRAAVTAVSDQVNVVEAGQPKSKQEKTADKFRVEYAYVIKDLRTIFILAGIMFALLIILNLFLN